LLGLGGFLEILALWTSLCSACTLSVPW